MGIEYVLFNRSKTIKSSKLSVPFYGGDNSANFVWFWFDCLYQEKVAVIEKSSSGLLRQDYIFELVLGSTLKKQLVR